MGQLRRAITLIAATTIIFVSPSVAKVVKFEVLKVESPAFEGRTFGAVGTLGAVDLGGAGGATTGVASQGPGTQASGNDSLTRAG